MTRLPRAAKFSWKRANRVIQWTREFLDRVVPLERGSHADVTEYSVVPAGRRTLRLHVTPQQR